MTITEKITAFASTLVGGFLIGLAITSKYGVPWWLWIIGALFILVGLLNFRRRK